MGDGAHNIKIVICQIDMPTWRLIWGGDAIRRQHGGQQKKKKRGCGLVWLLTVWDGGWMRATAGAGFSATDGRLNLPASEEKGVACGRGIR